MDVLKIDKNVLVIITILLARQNEVENHMMDNKFLTQNCQGFGRDSLLHARDMTLQMGIFDLEKS